MRVRLQIHRFSGDEFRDCAAIDGEPFVTVDGRCPEPGCTADPFRVAGSTPREVDDREVHAPAICVGCGACVGTLVVDYVTVFGFAEDRAVRQRVRVY